MKKFTQRLARSLGTKKPLVAALLSALCASPYAYAESSATVYGRVTGGLNYVSDIATGGGGASDKLGFGSNAWGVSMLGLRGAEDLGGGVKAVINLETMFTSGSGNLVVDGLWNRYAVVGLSSPKWGTLLVGNAMSLTDGELWMMDPTAMQSMSVATLVNARNWGPRANAITYNSPEFGGLSMRIQTGLGERADNAQANRQLSASASYVAEGLNVRALYEEIRDASGGFSNLYETSKEYALAASYKADAAKYFLGYCELRSGAKTVADANNPTAATRSQMVWAGINYEATPALTLIGAAYHVNLDKPGAGATLVVAGANYHLSKRTVLYATVGSVGNGANANFAAEVYGQRPNLGARQNGVYTGLAHYF